jgi:hypothetical protein
MMDFSCFKKNVGPAFFLVASLLNIAPVLAAHELAQPIIRKDCHEIVPSDFNALKMSHVDDSHKVEISQLCSEFEHYCASTRSVDLTSVSLAKKLSVLRDNHKKLQDLKQKLKKMKLYFQVPEDSEDYQKLLDRVMAREVFLGHLLALPKRIEHCINIPVTKVDNDPKILEDFILAWNPGHYQKQDLNKLAEQYKLQHKVRNITFDQAIDFYIWVDEVLKGSKTVLVHPSLLNRCVQDRKEYPKSSLKVNFSREGTARVSHPQLNLKSKKLPDLITYNYVLTYKGDLYIQDALCGGHVDIINGGPALCAGEIRFRDQKIYSLNNESGHYLPSDEDLEKSYNLLKEKYGMQIFNPDFRLQAHLDAE